MKKYVFFMHALALGVADCKQEGKKEASESRKGVIDVQGHPHELLTQLHGDKEDARILPQLTGTPTDTIKFSDIKCWAGVVDNTQEIDSAVLLVKFTSLPQFEYSQDSILAFGYRWNPLNQYGDSIHKYIIDMPHAWQAGWYYNYWTFYTKDQLTGPFIDSPVGASTRELHHGYVDGFVINDLNVWPPAKNMSGSYVSLYNCNCGCNN